jgi:hypothetical protein
MMDDEQFSLPQRLTDTTAAAFLADLSRWDQDPAPCSEADLDLLSLVIDEALGGVDISRRFPTFWAKLLASAELREAFLESLELLEAGRAGRLRPLPPPGAAVE